MGTKPHGRSGEANHMWRGGRSVASNGYVLIRRPDHPRADVRGYIYEHRLVAEEMLGRPLQRGEQVHHKDGNKQNNDPSNLEVMPTAAHHQYHHRTRESGRRLPGEANPMIACGCGCSGTFRRFDAGGRPRDYIIGHNPQDAPTEDLVLAFLSVGTTHRCDLSRDTGIPLKRLAVALSKLHRKGLAHSDGEGNWTMEEMAYV